MGKRSPVVVLGGRVARVLGFRWVFPVGTMAVPWHPAVLPLALAALVAWTVTQVVGLVVGAVDGAGVTAVSMAVGFVVAGLSMSVPILAWVVLAFGGRLVQALLALAAMVVLSVSVATGDDRPWLAVLPAAYALTWAVQAIGGRVLLARLRARVARFTPGDARGRALVLPADSEANTVRDLLARCGAGSVWVRSQGDGDGGRGHVLVTDEQASGLRRAARGALPREVTLEEVEGQTVLSWTGALPGPGALVVDRSRRPDPGGLLGEGLWRTTVDGRTAVTGRASVVLPVPMFNAFHWVSLTSKSQWVVGFGRGRPRSVGAADGAIRHLFGDGTPLGPTAPPHVLTALDDAWRLVADRDNALDRLASDASSGSVDLHEHRHALAELRRGGADLLGPDAGSVLASWLGRVREGRHEHETRTVAQLLETLSDEQVVRHGRRIHDVLNSRKLALRWQLTPDLDVTPLPRDLYRFGDHAGFGLALDVPGLYVRVGDLVPPFREIVRELSREMTLPEPIAEALQRWDEKDSSPPGGRT